MNKFDGFVLFSVPIFCGFGFVLIICITVFFVLKSKISSALVLVVNLFKSIFFSFNAFINNTVKITISPIKLTEAKKFLKSGFKINYTRCKVKTYHYDPS